MQKVDCCMNTLEYALQTPMQIPHPLDTHTKEKGCLSRQNFQASLT